MSDATDVLQAIDQLRRDLSGYHCQLKAHNDLQRHCDHQRERIAELEAIHARDKAENAKLREQGERLFDKTLELLAENARLRELVSELWVSCPVHDSDCDECQHKGGRMGCELYDRMRELGVGVDG